MVRYRDMNTKYTSIVNRFAKGIIGGAVAQMSIVALTQPLVWSDFNSILNALGLAFTFGAMTGLLLALQKFVSWEE
jgi:hypothetical protein